MASVEEIAVKIIGPMRALYRCPFGIEEPEKALVEYTKALKNIPGHLLDGAWDRIVTTHKKRDWPTISELMAATGHTNAVRIAATIPEAKIGNMHPSRINPGPEVQAFSFYESHLRKDAQWEKFLDGIHPSAEHNFFVQVELRGAGLEVPSEYRRDYIIDKFGPSLMATFERGVPIHINQSRKFRSLPTSTTPSRGSKHDF